MTRLLIALLPCLVGVLEAQAPTVTLTAATSVYALARADTEVRAVLPAGTTVTLVQQAGDWVAILGPDNVSGWIQAAALRGSSGAPPPSRFPGPAAPTPVRTPGTDRPPPQAGARQATGNGVYQTDRWLSAAFLKVEDTKQLALAMARRAGRVGEIGFTIYGSETPDVPDDFYVLGIAGNFRLFPVQPAATQPVGIVMEVVASTERPVQEDAETLGGVGGHLGAFARLPVGTQSAVLIPRAGYQVTRYLPFSDSWDPFTVKQWYLGGELQLGSLVPGAFIGASEGVSYFSVQLTIAY